MNYTLYVNDIEIDNFTFYKNAVKECMDICKKHRKFCDYYDMRFHTNRIPKFTVEIKYNDIVVEATCVYE